MPVLSEALWETLRCSICLETCKEPYRLPCEHFYCRGPCLQGLLDSAQPTCPNCRRAFSRADVVPFRTLNNIMNLIETPQQNNQQGEVAICPICTRQVGAPLKWSAHFAELVCADCWSTGEVFRKSNVDEPIQTESSGGNRRSGILTAEQNNQQGKEAVCPCCRQKKPLYMSEIFVEPVCNECRMSGEVALELTINETKV
ncbi:unnamed protein product [Dibothriocephalus latus]|uniref:RING-type E3 ubiquitin transferase n=1 Tax=Dibothriocephalus latus TaxID=60516 RepID=A0A3P7RJN2_DIBLA|nr:unnamed protein product [Dibothriocephalus latus]